MPAGEVGEQLVQKAMPGGALLGGEAVAEDVPPRGEDLAVDAYARHAGDAPGRLLDELGEERPHQQAVDEAEALAARLGVDHRDPETRAFPPQSLDDREGNVVGVDVNGHGIDRVCLGDTLGPAQEASDSAR